MQPPSNLKPGMLNLTQQQYTDVALAMQVEVWSKYSGLLDEIWFDGGDDMPGVNEALAQYQPQVCGGWGAWRRMWAWLGGFEGWACCLRCSGSAFSSVAGRGVNDVGHRDMDGWVML